MTNVPTTRELVAAFAPTGALRASINLGNPILAVTDAVTGALGLRRDALARHRIEGVSVAPPPSNAATTTQLRPRWTCPRIN